MAPERRNQVVLAVLVIVLVGAIYRAVTPSGPAAPQATVTADSRSRTGGDAAAVAAPDVRLEALSRERVTPTDVHRNLFRFASRPSATASAAPSRVPPPSAGPPPRPAAAVPTVPPIALKFIGVVQATEQSRTYAVLRDDRGVYHGREGDIIEGRYRILRIGAESIELSYVDGQGRQTIRLGS